MPWAQYLGRCSFSSPIVHLINLRVGTSLHFAPWHLFCLILDLTPFAPASNPPMEIYSDSLRLFSTFINATASGSLSTTLFLSSAPEGLVQHRVLRFKRHILHPTFTTHSAVITINNTNLIILPTIPSPVRLPYYLHLNNSPNAIGLLSFDFHHSPSLCPHSVSPSILII